MKIETAMKRVEQYYEQAKGMELVHNPVAWALYQVWREVDGEKPKRFIATEYPQEVQHDD